MVLNRIWEAERFVALNDLIESKKRVEPNRLFRVLLSVKQIYYHMKADFYEYDFQIASEMNDGMSSW